MTMGIYSITNTKTGKRYVGSSKDIETRFKSHMYGLRKKEHHSIKLQRSYNKYKNESIFHIEVLEETTEKQLLKREQYYIDLYDSFYNGYNCAATVEDQKYMNYHRYTIEQKKKDRNAAYKEFLYYYGNYNDCVIIGRIFTERLLMKHYKMPTYRKVTGLIKWFIDNYDTDNYICEISVNKSGQYYPRISDTDDNTFVVYEWKKGKAINSYYDTKMHRDYLAENGLLDEKKHYIIS